MTQHFADAFNVNPIFDTARRVSVTECVIAAFPDSTPAQDRFKVVLIGAWLHRLVFSSCQNISILRQTRNSFFQICHHIIRKRHDAHGVFTFWCLNDELRFLILTDTLYCALDAHSTIPEINIRNPQCANLAKP